MLLVDLLAQEEGGDGGDGVAGDGGNGDTEGDLDTPIPIGKRDDLYKNFTAKVGFTLDPHVMPSDQLLSRGYREAKAGVVSKDNPVGHGVRETQAR